jgi:hypothetical protein
MLCAVVRAPALRLRVARRERAMRVCCGANSLSLPCNAQGARDPRVLWR